MFHLRNSSYLLPVQSLASDSLISETDGPCLGSSPCTQWGFPSRQTAHVDDPGNGKAHLLCFSFVSWITVLCVTGYLISESSCFFCLSSFLVVCGKRIILLQLISSWPESAVPRPPWNTPSPLSVALPRFFPFLILS